MNQGYNNNNQGYVNQGYPPQQGQPNYYGRDAAGNEMS